MKYSKHIVNALLLSTALISLSVGAIPTGFYVGGGVGASNLDVNKSNHWIYPKWMGEKDLRNHSDNKKWGGLADLAVGYTMKDEQFILSTEFDASIYAKNQISQTIHNFLNNKGLTVASNDKLTSSLGLSVLPGFAFTDSTELYGRLGYIWGHYNTYSNDAGNLGYTGNLKKWLGGVRLGAGVEQQLTKKTDLRLEYDYTQYKKSKTTSHPESGNYFGDYSTNTTTIKPSSSQVLLSLIYHF